MNQVSSGFCPPKYYGDRCQNQNQRVSLTLTIAAPMDQQIIYALVVTLFDEDEDRQMSHSFDRLIRVPRFHCGESINLHLLYSHRTNNESRDLREVSIGLVRCEMRSIMVYIYSDMGAENNRSRRLLSSRK